MNYRKFQFTGMKHYLSQVMDISEPIDWPNAGNQTKDATIIYRQGVISPLNFIFKAMQLMMTIIMRQINLFINPLALAANLECRSNSPTGNQERTHSALLARCTANRLAIY